MGRSLVVITLALLGLLSAAGMGYAAYVVSRDSVAVPVTKLQQAPAQKLTPRRVVVRTHVNPRTATAPRTTRTVPPPAVTTTDDHGGRSPGGSGSGHGGGGHGGDDD